MDYKPGEVLVPNLRFLPRCDCDEGVDVKTEVTRWGGSRVMKITVECAKCGTLYEQETAYGVEGMPVAQIDQGEQDE